MSTFIMLWLIGACCMAAIIAGKKGHSAVSFFAGLILGVFGVLLAWWQDDLTKAEPPANTEHRSSSTFSASSSRS
jgi:hypothetical protein